MNLYLISQDVKRDYDTYDSAIVAAESEDEARNTHPSEAKDAWTCSYKMDAWTHPSNVSVKFICSGYEGEKGVILASFNAG